MNCGSREHRKGKEWITEEIIEKIRRRWELTSDTSKDGKEEYNIEHLGTR